MPSKKMKTQKVKKAQGKSKNTKSLSLLAQLCVSPLLLFVVFALALYKLMLLWQTQDNESLILFILIAFVVYTQCKNMILVLGIPLIVIHILLAMRSTFFNEGFVDYSSFDPYSFQEWIIEFAERGYDREYDEYEYKKFTEKLNDFGSLSSFMDNVMKSENQMVNDMDTTNTRSINELKDYIMLVNFMPKNDPMYDSEQAEYIRLIVKEYTSFIKNNSSTKEKEEKEEKEGREEKVIDENENEATEKSMEKEQEDKEEELKKDMDTIEEFKKGMEGLTNILKASKKN
jgi:hypothetical protein